MMGISLLYALCVWMGLISLSKETGYIYHFPAGTLQRIKSVQSASTGPPGTRSHSQVRNWCPYTVSKTVTCQVHNGTETAIQRVFQGCRWPGPCTKLISYRTLIRPSYRVAYKQVTALEWRCCPGFGGEDCREECMNCTAFTDMSNRLRAIETKLLQVASTPPPVMHLPEGNEVDNTPHPTPIGPPSYLPPVSGERGPPGPIGPPGHPGPAGPPGPAGELGLAGPIGPKGDRGSPGEVGLQGPPGPPGPPGSGITSGPLRGDVFQIDEQKELQVHRHPELPTPEMIPGPPGPHGPVGPEGSLGPRGPPGIPGLPGQDGENGLLGKAGYPGPKGDAGEKGLPGSKGDQGLPGSPGPKGEPGEDLSEGEAVQQLREALKILAERVLILEHMIGIHENAEGSGLGSVLDPLSFAVINTKRPQAVQASSLPPTIWERQRREPKSII